ncbi:Os12g0155250 [Oryza sativa Japonica Group]|uniref:Os12g0155250 protein n=1 Tax=Oryza sativa subsp. japonica TaxID=39947 RepID=A0A0N7KTL4_ORYSJ|nr:hypothetical protein EE612_057871 [Oryza sativa]BAT15946.1 Os12g0155250 [Oryza sativa Japonica Group]
MAILRAFILFICSSWTTSAIKLTAQSSKAASVGGRHLATRAQSSSDWHCITCSGGIESSTPLGSSLNHTLIRPAKQWTSIPSGTIPPFNWSLTSSSWLFSAFMRKIPSACKTALFIKTSLHHQENCWDTVSSGIIGALHRFC